MQNCVPFRLYSFKGKYTLGMIFLAFICHNTDAQSNSPYPHFDSWPKVNLKGGILACSPYQTEFEDHFSNATLDASRWDTYEDGNPIGGRYHCGAGSVIFTDENVQVNNGNLELTVKRENTPVSLTNPDVSGNLQPFDAHCCQDVLSVSRNVTAGMVSIDQSLVFNLGKYETRCQFPNKGSVWSTFWMFHHDEIDIFDLGFRSGMSQNSISEGYEASIEGSPCCSDFVDCDYCVSNSVDCTGSNGCNNCDYSCEYMADGFHVVGCEWTPFKIRFYVDGVTTGVVYRYHALDKTPIDVECGGIIPEGVVRENPAYIDIQGRGFRPEIWITVEQGCPNGDCNFASCPDAADPNDLPATLLIDYVKIEERVYERISLVPECYELCDNSQTPICINLESEYYNFIYDGHWNWNGPTPPIALSWSIPSNNGTVLPDSSTQGCFTYDHPDCSVSPCQRRMLVQAAVQMHTGVVHNLSKMLLPPKPIIYTSIFQEDIKQVCIEHYCDFDIIINNQPVDAHEGLNCFIADCNLHLEVIYDDCGNSVTLTDDVVLDVVPPNPEIFGTGTLCGGVEDDFMLDISLLPEASVITWSVEPSNLVSPSSGTGAIATFTGVNNNLNGFATLTFFVNNYCGTRAVSKQIFVGKPLVPVIDQIPNCFVPGSNVHLHATSGGATTYSWNFPYCSATYDPTGNQPFPQECWYNYTGNGSYDGAVFVHVGVNGGSVSVFANNQCGTSSINHPIIFCGGEPGGGGPIGPVLPLLGGGGGGTVYGQLYPNPTSVFLNLELDNTHFNPIPPKAVYIKNQSGNQALFETFTSNQHQFGVSNLLPGTHTMFVQTEERVLYVNFVKTE